ncbi:MAG: DUF1214 domain-containing protein [bacterium]|nr:DUF1214 domain-containing protein [bacterium]
MRSRWGLVVKVLATAAAALILGVGSALRTVRAQVEAHALANGPWRTSADIGAASADPSLRAVVALTGLLALNRSETVYYTATTDEAGAPLRSGCRYRIEGTDPPARWWSITAYAADSYLIPNPQHAYSVDRTRAERAPDGRFTIRVGGAPAPANWIATGPPGEPISLTLRLYQPDASVADDLVGTPLPAIHAEGCA